MNGKLEDRMMRKNVVIAVVWTVVLGMALVAAAGEMYEDYYDQTFTVGANPEVSLENINGDVSIDVWDGDQVRVQATKRASSHELLDKLEIDVRVSDSSIKIETDYPSGTHRNGKMSVEYTLLVPRGASLDGVELVNGNLSIDGVEGGTDVEMVNGDVRAAGLAGSVSVESVNGAVELRINSLQPSENVSVEAVNGSIDVYLAPGIGARIDADTVNGRLSNNAGIEVDKGKYVGASMRGTVAGGGATISLESVNASISVHSG
jgi:DUF4097 and DUF4098 domain-containing protein YvlB